MSVWCEDERVAQGKKKTGIRGGKKMHVCMSINKRKERKKRRRKKKKEDSVSILIVFFFLQMSHFFILPQFEERGKIGEVLNGDKEQGGKAKGERPRLTSKIK
jgi:hypothetical protein